MPPAWDTQEDSCVWAQAHQTATPVVVGVDTAQQEQQLRQEEQEERLQLPHAGSDGSPPAADYLPGRASPFSSRVHPLQGQRAAASAVPVLPTLSAGASLGSSLGSGFGPAGQVGEEEEVTQFLRGSIAAGAARGPPPPQAVGISAVGGGLRASQQQQQQQPPHPHQYSRLRQSSSALPTFAPAPALPAVQLGGNIDLAAILDSQPSSPQEQRPTHTVLDSSALEGLLASGSSWLEGAQGSPHQPAQPCEQPPEPSDDQQAGEWEQGHTANTGAAVAELQLLRVSARSPSPSRRPATASGASSSDMSAVVLETFPQGAVARLEQLKLRLSQGRLSPGLLSPGSSGGPGAIAASPPGTALGAAEASTPTSSGGRLHQGSHPLAAWPSPLSEGTGSRDVFSRPALDGLQALRHTAPPEAGTPASSTSAPASPAPTGALTPSVPHQAATPLLSPRPLSAELGPGLPPGVTRRGAQLLQGAVGRMAGNPGESADAAGAGDGDLLWGIAGGNCVAGLPTEVQGQVRPPPPRACPHSTQGSACC